jgi:DNA-binding LacI/PurR family transcriptional regulator/DNA-binding transcriptional regulator YhcF (GntR family)
MNRSTPSKQRAKQWLHKSIASALASSVYDLPSIRECARCAGVALVTMQKAAKELHEEGCLVVRPGSGIRVRLQGESQPQETIPVSLKSWKHVENELMKRIAQSFYRDGVLIPPFKKLCLEFGVGYESVKKAVESLVHAGMLQRSGRKYRVPSIASSRQGSSILLILSGYDRKEVGLDDQFLPRVGQCLHTVETECLKAGLRLYIVVFHMKDYLFYHKDSRIELTTAFLEQRQILGVMYWPIGTNEEMFHEVMKRISGCKLPVTTVFESPVAIPAAHPPVFKCYSMSIDAAPGEIAGRYLYRLGHRDIAYVEVSTSEWSSRRFEGLGKVFGPATSSSVTPYTMTGLADENPRADDNSMTERIQTFIRDMLHRSDASIEQDEINMLRHKISTALHLELLREKLLPFLDMVAANRRHTAWVCQNDFIALIALQYLAHKRIPVPETLSVMGFDDTRAARVEGLTSYNFNMSAFVQNMLEYILHINRFKDHSLKAPMTFEGVIIERFSVKSLVSGS